MSYLTQPIEELQRAVIASLEGEGFAFNPLTTTFPQHLATCLGTPTAYKTKTVTQMLAELNVQFDGVAMSRLTSGYAELLGTLNETLSEGGGGAPLLSDALLENIDDSSARAFVTTNDGTGTLYWVMTTPALAEGITFENIIAGEDTAGEALSGSVLADEGENDLVVDMLDPGEYVVVFAQINGGEAESNAVNSNTCVLDAGAWLPASAPGAVIYEAAFNRTDYVDAGIFVDELDQNGYEYTAAHVQSGIGYVATESSEGFRLSDAVMGAIDKTDYAVIFEIDAGETTVSYSMYSAVQSDDFNVYWTLDGNIGGATTLPSSQAVVSYGPRMGFHRYAFSVKPDDNFVAMDGRLSATDTTDVGDLAGADWFVHEFPFETDQVVAVRKFAVISPCPAAADLQTWSSVLTTAVYGTATTSDLDFENDAYVVDGTTLANIAALGAVAFSSGTAGHVPGAGGGIVADGVASAGSAQVAFDITHAIPAVAMRDNFSIMYEFTLPADSQHHADLTVYQIGEESIRLVIRPVIDGDSAFEGRPADGLEDSDTFTSPAAGRHKAGFRMVAGETSAFLDGVEVVADREFVQEYLNPSKIRAGAFADGANVVIHRVYITAPLDDAGMIALTT
jgi:hypothetical protein